MDLVRRNGLQAIGGMSAQERAPEWYYAMHANQRRREKRARLAREAALEAVQAVQHSREIKAIYWHEIYCWWRPMRSIV